jgi:predicted Zn-dependent protease
MIESISFSGGLIALGVFSLMGHFLSQRVFGETDARAYRQFLTWVAKGLAVPVLLWLLFNSGLLPRLPALVSAADFALGVGAKGFPLWLNAVGGGLVVISSFWAVVTFGGLLVLISDRVEDQPRLIRMAGLWLLPAVPLGALILFAFGWDAIGFALLAWLIPVAHAAVALMEKPRVQPTYSRAVASLKFGKYRDAEAQVIDQLERCEDDFEGWMMLAELYARQFHDLPEADRAIRELCNQPNVTPVQISLALHRLADWHLHLGEDPQSARRALEEIGRCFPGTHFDRMARVRISQLPASRDEWIEQRRVKPLRLPALNDPLDDVEAESEPSVDRNTAQAALNSCLERLRQDPNDVPVREKLAELLIGLRQADEAIDHLGLLLAMPGQPSEKQAVWLSQMAAWHLRHRHDPAAARPLLERLIQDHPQSGQAFAAQRRLSQMDIEDRGARRRAAAQG